MKRGFLGGGSEKKAEPERLRRIRQEVKDAEAELRRLRSQRIRAVGPPRTADGTAGLLDLEIQEEEKAAAAADKSASADLKGLPEASLSDLLELQEPPAAVVHRLAELLTILLKAPALVSLGQAPLPRSVPWENLQALLKRLTVTPPDSSKILAALREKPFGTRLRQHLLTYLSEGDVEVLRSEVEAVDPKLVDVHDFVIQLLTASQDRDDIEDGNEGMASDMKEDSQEALATAVAEQEKEVTRLRRKLKEVEKSEAAAQDFVERNAPKSSISTAETEAAPEQEAPAAPSSAAPVQATVDTRGSAASLKHPEVVCARELQYRLGESGVPSMQEAILMSIEKLMNEPRINEARQLHILGRAEVREEPSLAAERAAAVERWFLERGLPSEAIKVETCPESERGNRRVELRLFGEAGSHDTVRNRAEGLLARAGILQREELETAAEATLAAAVASEEESKLGEAGEDAPAVVSLKVLPPESEGACRGVKLVFSLAGHPASDVNLEISEALVRLSSLKDDWLFPPLDTEIPFKVEAAGAGGARFSRKAGTLTLTLWEKDA